MSDTLKQILFFVAVFFANIIQCITGFAGTTLAMPFGLLTVGYDVCKPILNILGILSSAGVVMFNAKKINWREFWHICLIMLPGLVIGIVLIQWINVDKTILYLLLAGIIVLFMCIGIYTNFIKKEKEEKPSKIRNFLLDCVCFLSGVVQGMFVCGGALLAVYASRRLKDRDEFRSTLSMCWIILNCIILVSDIINGYFRAEVFSNMMFNLVVCAVCVVVALLIGDFLAKKMDRKVFLIVTYILMGISALSLILNVCGVF